MFWEKIGSCVIASDFPRKFTLRPEPSLILGCDFFAEIPKLESLGRFQYTIVVRGVTHDHIAGNTWNCRGFGNIL